jgi:HK97 family phage prohead protease
MAYSDYPQSATNNAKKALKYADENGWGSCGTAVGKARANSLAKRESLSAKTVKRIYSFLSRHAQNADVPYGEGCGGLMYDAWGGKSMLPWAKRTVEKMNEKNSDLEAEIRQKYGEDVELRTMELRAAEDAESDNMVLEGYAANFDTTTDLGFFQERIARGAFDNVLQDDVRYLLNHDGMPLARTTNGTLELRVDDNGLYTRAILNDTQLGRDTYKAVKRGDISQMSFAFVIDEQEVDTEANLRTVTKVKRLYDVSAVTYPAYPTTTLQARSAFTANDDLEPESDVIIADGQGYTVVEENDEPTVAKAENEKKISRTFTETNAKGKKAMNLNDLKGQRAAYYEEFVEIGKLVEADGRAMTEAEQERADRLTDLMEQIDQKIKHKLREQEMVARMAQAGVSSTSEEKEIAATNYRFSLSRAINQIRMNEKLEGAEAEWQQQAHSEMRQQGLQPNGMVGIPSIAMRAGAADNFQAGSGDGSGFVATDVPAAIEALRAPTLIETLGTNVINATGNLKFPRVSVAGTVGETGEVAANTTAGLELDEVTMSPTRVSTKTKYSQQLILQGGPEVDRLIAGDLNADMVEHIDREAFKHVLANAGDDQSTAGTGDTVFTTLIADNMEAAVLAAGGDLSGCNYVMSPTAYKLSKSLARVSNVSALFDNGLFNGYKPVPTKHIADETANTVGQMIFGNFRQGLLLAYFSGIDLLVDPYTAAGTGQVILHLNRYYDVAVRQAGAFSVCTDLDAS